MIKKKGTFIKLLLKLEKTESKYETAVKKSTCNPVFNESYEFNIATFQVENAELFIYVYSKRVLTSKNLIGCISFGMHYFDLNYLFTFLVHIHTLHDHYKQKNR